MTLHNAVCNKNRNELTVFQFHALNILIQEIYTALTEHHGTK